MLSKTDQAKYPIVPEAVEFVRERGLTVDELADQSYAAILDRAETRLRQAIENGLVSSEWQDDSIEILSFPAAMYIATVLQDDWVRRRFALAESRRASRFLANETLDRIVEVASKTFEWKVDLSETDMDKRMPSLRIGFKNYVKNAMRIREPKWKLTNRQLNNGFVEVSKDEAARLLEEEIQNRILSRMRDRAADEPDFLKERIERLRKLVKERKGTGTFEDLPKSVVFAAIPPCIRYLYDSVQSGKHIPHVGRFALTCFLVNVGASEEELLRLFKTAADFDERKTRYQVEHIAGAKGGRTKYTPPKCATLKTHGLCVSPDKLCSQISHPLSYYRRKIRPALQKDQRHARS
jgi:DNA primase large subunit